MEQDRGTIQNTTESHFSTGDVIGVIIPCYRVAPFIAGVLEKIPPFVDHVIVVDDCSPDNLQEVLASISSPRIHIVRHEKNGGVGAALKTGYQAALERGCTIMVKVDGDGQIDPTRIPDLIEPILAGRADYAKGNRFIHRTELKSMPPLRRYGNIGLTFLTKFASGCWGIFDPSNGFTALHKSTWEALRKDRIASGYYFETSMLIEIGCARGVIEDVSLPARYGDETSSLSPVRVGLEFPLKLLAGLFSRIGTWYFMHDFTPVSFCLVVGTLALLFAAGWGGFHWCVSLRTGVAAATGTVMLAVVSLILGVQLLLQGFAMDIQNTPKTPIQNRNGNRRR